MHEVLAQVVSREAGKLLELAEQDARLEKEDLEALEILARCAKSLKVDTPPPAGPQPTTEEALATVETA